MRLGQSPSPLTLYQFGRGYCRLGIIRAGWYSYDWLDNLGRPSAREIIPELPQLEIGDLIPMGSRRQTFKPHEWMKCVDDQSDTSWLWLLDRVDDGTTRLITRVRMKIPLVSSGKGFRSSATW